MAGVYEEFERELADFKKKYAANPRREIVELLLLGLEREEIVSVAYREETIVHRLQSLDIPESLRDLIHSALLWAWKDEEMHAIYIRGALFKLGSPYLKAISMLRQFSGGFGGWAGAVRQHLSWSEAPVSRLLATGLTWAGAMMGQIPRQVRPHLDYQSFRDYCLFNVDAERTAALCFRRLVQLIETDQNFPPSLARDLRRTQEDEVRHEMVFKAIADSLNDKDQIKESTSVEGLERKLRQTGEFFLPRALRVTGAEENPMGSGGRVFVARGEPKQKLEIFNEVVDQSGLDQLIRARAERIGKKLTDVKVAIKANFMLGYHRKDKSSITDPELLEALALRLKSLGCGDVAVLEQRNLYDRFYKNRSVSDVASYFGITSPAYRLVDVSEDQIAHSYFRGLGQETICQTWRDADFRISFAKMKSHPVGIVYLTVGNFDGLGARCDEFLFVERQAHRDTATLMPMSDFPSHFAILDACETAGDGLLGMLACPRPKSPGRIYVACDAVALDLVAARHMRIKDPSQCGTLKAACQWFGDPTENTEVIGCNEPIADWINPLHNEWTSFLALLANPVYQYSSSRGAVFVPEMDEEAFPTIEPEGWILKARRRSLQVFLGLRHKR